MQELASSGLVSLPHLGRAAIRDMLDYVDSSSGNNPSRRPPLLWWGDFIGDAVKFNAPGVKTLPSSKSTEHTKTRNHFERLLNSITVFRYGLGVDLLKETERAYALLTDEKIAKIERLSNS